MQTIELPFTTLEIHDRFAIARTHEGVHVTMDEHRAVLDAIKEYLIAPFAFIIDEVNSYSVDLGVMLDISECTDISCVGVMYYRPASRLALEFGELVIEKPIYFSDNMDEVINWVTMQA